MASLVGCIPLASCAFVAEHTASEKQAAATRTPAAIRADALFWNTLHDGRYEQIAPVLEAETAAYLENPNDAISAAHIGWLHIWQLSERNRRASIPATITDEAILARKYFAEAVELNADDPRYQGFLASAALIEGSIQHDERETRRGYFMLRAAIKAWPEFNLFTAGYSLSTLPAASERYHQALEWQWQTLDSCAGEKVDRKTAAYAPYMALATDKGAKRVCWNSWIAPHNFEGFFLNLGDMLVKAGDWRTARLAYGDARLSATYAQWPYRRVLEDRIRDAPDNVAAFNTPVDAADRSDRHIMVATSFACMGCHQR